MKTKIIPIILTVFLASALTATFNISPANAQPTVWIVPDMRPTIQDAINVASPGDKIHVRSGTYIESLIINTPDLTLTGQCGSDTIIDVGPLNPGMPPIDAIWIIADNVKIIEFTIRCSIPIPPEWPLPNGIIIESSTGCSILNNEIQDFANTGITVFYSNDTYIMGNHINHCGIGIYLESSNRNIIRGNQAIEVNGVGIQMVSSSDNSVYYNNFDKNGPPQAQVISGDTNAWDDGRSKGNWWSDYVPPPPYIIDPNNQDNYPLPDPWTPISGDINYDGICDMKDIYQLILHFMCSQGQLCYVPNYDINCDGVINMKDIYIAIRHYGETDP